MEGGSTWGWLLAKVPWSGWEIPSQRYIACQLQPRPFLRSQQDKGLLKESSSLWLLFNQWKQLETKVDQIKTRDQNTGVCSNYRSRSFRVRVCLSDRAFVQIPLSEGLGCGSLVQPA